MAASDNNLVPILTNLGHTVYDQAFFVMVLHCILSHISSTAYKFVCSLLVVLQKKWEW